MHACIYIGTYHRNTPISMVHHNTPTRYAGVSQRWGAGARCLEVRGAGVDFGRTKYLQFLSNMHEFGTITTYFWSYND